MGVLLAVDDSRLHLMFVEKFSKELAPDLKVVKAESGEEALKVVGALDDDLVMAIIDYKLDILQKQICSLIITDMRMPRMNGIELLDELLPKLSADKMVLCTANAQAIIEQKVKSRGAHHFVKPFTKEKFKVFVDKIIHKQG